MNQKQSANGISSDSFFGMKLTDYIAIVVRGKWRVLAVFVVVLGTTVALTLLMKPTYESTTSLVVDTRSSPSALFQDARTLGMTVDVIQNEMALLSSKAVAHAVAEQLIQQKYIDTVKKTLLPAVLPVEGDTANPTIASPATVMARLAKTVTFSSERESYVISINATSTNPREAALIATTYAKQYVERNVFTSRSRSRSFREFLGHQLAEKRDALKQKEDSLQSYMQRRGVVDLDNETKTLMDQMATLEAQRDANDIEIRSLLSQLASYKAQIDQQEKSIAKSIGQASDSYIRLLQGQLAQLEVQRDITVAQNRSTVGQGINNDRIKEIDAQIADLRQKLQARTQEYVQDILPASGQPSTEDDPAGYLKQIKQKFIETQITIQTLQAKRDAMNEALLQYEHQFGKVPSKSVEYARLLREKVSVEALYSLLEGKYNEANVTEQSEFGSVEIFDAAVVPLEPSSPNVFLNVALGIVLGLGMGIAYVFVKEFLAQRLYSPEDLVRRGYVPLSIIGMPDQKKGKGAKGSDGIKGREFTYRLAMTSSFSRVTEAFRHLRTNLQATNNGTSPKTIMISSPDPGEGKTTVACNLAVVMAQGGRKVLLVDADMREPAVYIAFGMDTKNGLAQILSGKSESDQLIRETQTPNLHVLCSGHSPSNAAELLESADMKFFVSQVAERFDVIVFDSPPVLAVSDALILSRIVDKVIIVVSAGETKFSALERATDMLTNVGAKIAGVVLNKFDARSAYGSFSTASGYGYYGYAERYGTNGDGKRKETSKRVS